MINQSINQSVNQSIKQPVQQAVTGSITGCDLSDMDLPTICPRKGSTKRCFVASHTHSLGVAVLAFETELTVRAYKLQQICHITSCHVMSRHVTSRHVTSRHVMSCHVMSCHVMSHHVMSYAESGVSTCCLLKAVANGCDATL